MKNRASIQSKSSSSSLSIAVILITLLTWSCESQKEKEPFLFGLGFGVNNTTLYVDSLEKAQTYFQDTLGFSFRGNASRGSYAGSASVLATFADNSQLELLTINDTLDNAQISKTLSNLNAKESGSILYALSTSSADSTGSWLSSLTYALDSMESYRFSTETPDGWTRDDGSPQRKNLNFSSKPLNPYLPQFVEQTDFDYEFVNQEWRTYYGFWRSFRNHPNGVVGTRAIRIWVSNLEGTSLEFENMGFDLISKTENEVNFRVSKTQEVQLYTSSEQPSDTSNSRVESILFEVEDIDSTYAFFQNKLPDSALSISGSPARITIDPAFAYGFNLQFIQEPEEQGAMAQILQMGGKMDSSTIKYAADMYEKYCALCHGEDREGYAADHAPSLRSKSLLATSQGTNFMRYTIQYGRANTAMGGYLSTQGGPMDYIDIEILLNWLYDTAGIEEPIQLSREQVLGDIEVGKNVYANNCAICHGENGEGISAPALGNPMLLATATDHFLRYAIAEGRDGTPMVAFKETLSDSEIDGVTAFLRSRASGWDVPPSTDSVTIPKPEDYILNASRNVPSFELKEGKYLPAVQLKQAMDDSLRMIILDARSEVAWRQMHIPGSVPVPYYEDPETFIEHIPNDSTLIVVYCACPHAASQRVVTTLNREGYKNTAILDEGILVWAQMGFPVRNGN